jgi:heat shock 70kDa protein 4
LKIEQKFTTHKIIKNAETNKITFDCENMGTKHEFSVEQVLGFYLTKIKEFYAVSGIDMRECVLTIPSYASHVERQSLLDAAAIAGLRCPRIINESTAIALRYGFFRQKDFVKEKPRKVAFVDFGHSKTTCTIAEFTPDKVKIICHHSERNLGARDFDYKVMQKLAAEFDKKHGDDPMESPRCKLRLMEAIEKARKTLSADKEAQINVDYLLNEEDLNRNLKREEFEELVTPCLTRFREVLEETIVLSKLNIEEIEFVELLSDATRMPTIQ